MALKLEDREKRRKIAFVTLTLLYLFAIVAACGAIKFGGRCGVGIAYVVGGTGNVERLSWLALIGFLCLPAATDLAVLTMRVTGIKRDEAYTVVENTEWTGTTAFRGSRRQTVLVYYPFLAFFTAVFALTKTLC